MSYSLGYKGIEGSSCGANTASEEFVDTDVPAALGGILPGAMGRSAARTLQSFSPAPKLLTSGR